MNIKEEIKKIEESLLELQQQEQNLSKQREQILDEINNGDLSEEKKRSKYRDKAFIERQINGLRERINNLNTRLSNCKSLLYDMALTTVLQEPESIEAVINDFLKKEEQKLKSMEANRNELLSQAEKADDQHSKETIQQRLEKLEADINSLRGRIDSVKTFSLESKRNLLATMFGGIDLTYLKSVNSYQAKDIRDTIQGLEIDLNEYKNLVERSLPISDEMAKLEIFKEVKELIQLRQSIKSIKSDVDTVTHEQVLLEQDMVDARKAAIESSGNPDVDSLLLEYDKVGAQLEEEEQLLGEEMTALMTAESENDTINAQNLYINKKGKEVTGLMKFFFKFTKTYKENESKKKAALEAARAKIESLSKTVDERGNLVSSLKAEKAQMQAQYTPEVKRYQDCKTSYANIWKELDKKQFALNEQIQKLSDLKEQSLEAARYDELLPKYERLQQAISTKKEEISTTLSSLDKDTVEAIEPGLYDSITQALASSTSLELTDEQIGTLYAVENTSRTVETKYDQTPDLIQKLINGEITMNQLTLDEAGQLVMASYGDEEESVKAK